MASPWPPVSSLSPLRTAADRPPPPTLSLRSQAKFLDKSKVWLRDVVHLDIAPKEAEAAVTGLRYDPYDGEVYHLDTNPPAHPDTLARLVTHPQHKSAVVKKQLRGWAKEKGALLKIYGGVLRPEDAKRSERELVERLAPCFLSL